MNRFENEIRKKKSEGFIPVIPDIKCISPKEGDLLKGRNPVEEAAALANLGAPAFSVVTETANFGGSMKLLENIVKATGRPVLRKDFIKSKEDLIRTKDCGADAVLLICSMQTESSLRELLNEAVKIGLEPLVETHTCEELAFAGNIGAKIIGINNRNILELENDNGTVSTTEKLASFVPKSSLLISESGISTPRDACAAISAGADAVLVGTAIWKADCLTEFYLSLCNANINLQSKIPFDCKSV